MVEPEGQSGLNFDFSTGAAIFNALGEGLGLLEKSSLTKWYFFFYGLSCLNFF